jgi:hypothetical protein
MFKLWFESTLDELYQSAVDAFPNTTKRQHATHPVEIERIFWTPYIGMKTLMIKAEIRNEDKHYNSFIVFKGVKYHDKKAPNLIEIVDSTKKHYFLEQLSSENHDVLLRCSCGDFHWRFNYFDHLDKSLYSRKRRKYEALHNPGSANPKEMPGMCKHLMKLIEALGETNALT